MREVKSADSENGVVVGVEGRSCGSRFEGPTAMPTSCSKCIQSGVLPPDFVIGPSGDEPPFCLRAR